MSRAGDRTLGAPEAPPVAAVQRRTVRTLVLVQAVGALGFTIGIATASLLARDLSGSDQQAGLAQTSQVLGAAVASYLLARLMAGRGRRIGLTTGYLCAAAGAAGAVVAGSIGSMALLLGSMLLLGAATASNAAARYAATDLAEEHGRARALSMVVWATTIGAVLGPNLTGPSADLAAALRVPELTGPFVLGGAALLVAGGLAALLLRPDPLLLARELAGEVRLPGTGTAWRRVLDVLRHRPALAAAFVALGGAHATMVAVMVMTPLHMEHGGAELRVIGFVISVHVLGMFALSPVAGWLSDWWGRAPVVATGGVVLLVATLLCALAPEGTSWQIFTGLFLLGLGWSLATVGASALVVDHAPLEVRTDVQGSADMVMGLTAAAASAFAGVVVGELGFPALAGGAALLAAVVVASGVAARR